MLINENLFVNVSKDYRFLFRLYHSCHWKKKSFILFFVFFYLFQEKNVVCLLFSINLCEFQDDKDAISIGRKWNKRQRALS